ncbi:hypothetical protein [Marivirga sp.]|uniref:hypothetical protein n=1 Tax=Marivirga sp. TaxID=2018662 RepID=UPI002D8053B8|nr:hypothetical protein [Marivirga sp.]HET8858377.1 hypothetical protein [Marivirga sp.]
MKFINLVTFFVIVSFWSCQTPDSEYKTKNVSLQIVDSFHVAINKVSFHLQDYNEKTQTYLAYDAVLKTLYELNDSFELKKKIDLEHKDKNGYGPQNFGSCYLNDSTVAVLGFDSFYFYNTDWELIRNIPLPDNRTALQQPNWAIYSLNDGNSILFSSKIRGEENSKPPLTLLNLEESATSPITTFGEYTKESLYLKEANSQLTNTVLFSASDDKIFSINEHEPVFAEYDLDGSILNQNTLFIDGFFKNFNPLDFNLTGRERLQDEAKNDVIKSLHTHENTHALNLFKGKDDPDDDLQRYLVLLKGNNISQPIEFKPPFLGLGAFLPNGDLLMHASPKDQEKSSGFWYYKVKIEGL